MKQHWLYLKAVCRHKWFVFLACLKFRVPIWSAIFHDWDKFSPEMWLPYAAYFYGPDANKRDASGAYVKEPGQQSAFDYAWNGHQKRNKHHWQYWVLFEDSGAVFALPMPDRARREMLADWFGAGRAYNKDWTPLEPRKWYEKNKDKMQLHDDTRGWVEAELLRRETDYLNDQRMRAILGM